MTVTPASFVVQFPAFGNQAMFPEATVAALIAEAYMMLNPNAWGGILDTGVAYYVAHFLILQARDMRSASLNGLPGEMTGAVSGKSLGGASKSYDTGGSAIAKGGQWNLTTYGVRFLQLSRLAGMGGVYVAGPPCIGGPPSAGSA